MAAFAYCVLRIAYCAPGFGCVCVLCIVYCVLRIAYCVLRTWLWLQLCIVHCVLCIAHPALAAIAYCVYTVNRLHRIDAPVTGDSKMHFVSHLRGFVSRDPVCVSWGSDGETGGVGGRATLHPRENWPHTHNGPQSTYLSKHMYNIYPRSLHPPSDGTTAHTPTPQLRSSFKSRPRRRRGLA